MPDRQEVDEIRLLDKATQGDAEAYGVLYELHAEAIFRFLYSHVDNYLDAEDLTEDVFLRAWRSLPRFNHQGVPFIAFLFKIARNALIDHYRRSAQTKKNLQLEENLISDASPDPSEIALTSLQHVEIRNMLDKLREEYRTVLVLRFLADLSPTETAEAMGKSPGAVRVLQHRALSALRKLMVEP